MRRSDVIELLTLAALWGGSFLFMRVAAPLFGPVALIALRVAIASAFLLPVLAMRGGLGVLRAQWPHLLAVGILNSAIPFCLFAYAELTLTAGFTSVLNAAAPLFAAIVAFVWLGERMSSWRVLGLAIGFVGVIVLVGGSSALDAGQGGLAVAAALGATVLYGLASSYTKRHLTGVPPLAVATGSQVAAAIVLAPLAVWLWPAHTPTGSVWFHVIGLGIACTGIAYILFFRLVAHVGPDARGVGDLPDPGVRRAVGHPVPGRTADAEHGGRLRGDPAGHVAVHRCAGPRQAREHQRGERRRQQQGFAAAPGPLRAAPEATRRPGRVDTGEGRPARAALAGPRST